MGSKNSRRCVVARPFLFEKDYATIDKWWIEHKSFAPKREHLSRTGFVVDIDSEPVCAGWVYRTDSAFCIFEFVVCNPDASKDDRDKALERLIKLVKAWAKDNRFGMIYSSIGIKSYIKRLRNEGFIVADTGQTHMFKEI